MKLAYFALLALIAAGPAIGEEENVNRDLDFAQDGVIDEIAHDDWPYEDVITPSPEALFTTFSASSLGFKLFDQPLSKFQSAFGGTIQEHWSAGYHHTWLCYTSGGQRIWYIADYSEANDGDLVGWIVQEPSNPATDANYGCVEQPLAILTQPQVYPAIGASLADINSQFGTALPEGTTRASFQLLEDSSLTRTAYYRLKDGVVDGVSFSQWEWRE